MPTQEDATKVTRGRARGRPRLEGEAVRVRLTLTLRDGEDDDLIAWFAALPAGERARRVKAALRQGGAALPDGSTGPEGLIDDDALAEMLAGI